MKKKTPKATSCLFLVLLLALCSSDRTQAQDTYDQLKLQYDSLLSAGDEAAALPITKAMNQWALENESDTSLRYAVSFRYIGNCFADNDSALKYYALSKYFLETQKRIMHLDYSRSLNNIGNCYNKKQDFNTALDNYNSAIDIIYKIIGMYNQDYLRIAFNIGDLYFNISDYDKAETYFSYCLNIQSLLFGVKNVNYANYNYNLGLLKIKKHEYQNSIQYILLAEEIYGQLFGEYNDLVTDCNISLGLSYYQMSDFQSSLHHYLIGTEQYSKLHGDTSMDFANYAFNVALASMQLSNFDTAESFALKSLEIRSHKIGELHKDCLSTIELLADLYTEIEKLDIAEKYLKKALTINQTTNKNIEINQDKYIRTITKLGDLYFDLADYNKAIKFYTQGFNEIKAKYKMAFKDLANISCRLADSYYRIDKQDKSIYYYKSALNLLRKIGNEETDQNAKVWESLSESFNKKGNYKKALYYDDRAIKFYASNIAEFHVAYIDVLNHMGAIYDKMNIKDKAKSFYVAGLELINKYNDNQSSYMYLLKNLGYLYHNQSDYFKARNCFEQAIKIGLSNVDVDYLLYLSFIGAGISSYYLSEFERAEQYYSHAKLILSKLNSPLLLDSTLLLVNMGNNYQKLANYKQAYDNYLEASNRLSKCNNNDSRSSYIMTLNNLGIIRGKMGAYNDALNYFKEALDISEMYFNSISEEMFLCNQNLGVSNRLISDYDNSIKHTKKALLIAKKLNGKMHINYTSALGNLASLNTSLKNYSLAKKQFEECLKLEEKIFDKTSDNYMATLSNYANMLSDFGDTTAELYYKESYTGRRKLYGKSHPDIENSLWNLINFYSEWNKLDTLVYYSNMLFELKASRLANEFPWLSENYKEQYYGFHEPFFTGIQNECARSISKLPSISTLSYNSLLLTKVLLLDETSSFNLVIAKHSDSIIQNSYNNLVRMKRTSIAMGLNYMKDKKILDDLSNEMDSLEYFLIVKMGTLLQKCSTFDIRWTDVQNSLKPDEAAIEFTRYYDYDDSTYKYMVQVVRPEYEYPHIVRLCRDQDLAAFSGGQGLAELYKLVWQPLDSLLHGVKTVYYSPDGQLHSVPFHALCVNDSGGCTYLMDRYTLHQLSTTRYLADSSLINAKPLNASIALYGGIRYDVTPDTLAQPHEESNEDFLLANTLKRETTRGTAAFLPGSKAEVEAIAPMLNSLKWTTSMTTGKEASENIFKALSDTASPSIIHIATHGFAFPEKEDKKKSRFEMMSVGNEQNRYSAADDPMLRCGLMFAGANRSWTGQQQEMITQTGEDGILTAAEVANMDLSNTKLVVLSACETGLGKIEGSEGVFGLQRGFKLAGVEQLIVSLWQVPDKETNTLMVRFYADLAITKDPVKSFATAQREMRERYSDNPELWAGFVLVR